MLRWRLLRIYILQVNRCLQAHCILLSCSLPWLPVLMKEQMVFCFLFMPHKRMSWIFTSPNDLLKELSPSTGWNWNLIKNYFKNAVIIVAIVLCKKHLINFYYPAFFLLLQGQCWMCLIYSSSKSLIPNKKGTFNCQCCIRFTNSHNCCLKSSCLSKFQQSNHELIKTPCSISLLLQR